MLKIDGRRTFVYNNKHYRIQNLPAKDRTDGKKYYITVLNNNIYMCCYMMGELPKFKTIKDAQRYVRDWDSELNIE